MDMEFIVDGERFTAEVTLVKGVNFDANWDFSVPGKVCIRVALYVVTERRGIAYVDFDVSPFGDTREKTTPALKVPWLQMRIDGFRTHQMWSQLAFGDMWEKDKGEWRPFIEAIKSGLTDEDIRRCIRIWSVLQTEADKIGNDIREKEIYEGWEDY